jgi:hypothetical protein
MTETPLAVLNQGQAEAFERAAAAARAERQPAVACQLAIRHTDALMGKAARSALALHDTWDAAWSDLEERVVEAQEVQEIGAHLRELFSRWNALLASMRQDALDLAARGHDLTSAPLLERALEKVCRLQDMLEKNWPWADRPWLPLDPNKIQESRAAITRGDGKDIEDLMRELQGRVRPGNLGLPSN